MLNFIQTFILEISIFTDDIIKRFINDLSIAIHAFYFLRLQTKIDLFLHKINEIIYFYNLVNFLYK